MSLPVGSTVNRKKRGLSRPCHQIVNEAAKWIRPSISPHPRCDQPAAQDYPDAGPLPFQEADHGKGAQRLAEIV